jgi:predicted membrane channel-forming protein YqfA (hemolysin III family)
MSNNTFVLNIFTILGLFNIFLFSFLFSMWQTLYFHCISFDGAIFLLGLVFKLLEMGAKNKPCTPPFPHKRKKMGHPMRMWISLCLHENSIPKTFYHHFWHGLIFLIGYPLIRAWVLRPTLH